jgi:hypothetical protein
MTTHAPTSVTGRQRLILFLLLGSQFMLSVDFSILNIALSRECPERSQGINRRA